MHAMTVKRRPSRAEVPRIEQQAVDVLGRVQTTIRDLIMATPGMTRRPADLTRTLGVHSKLAWQVHRLAHADDPLSQAGNVPGPAAMERFLEAAAKRGAPAERVAAARSALGDFEKLIDVHASSRGEFDSIISGLSPTGSEQVDLTHKRAIFKGQSHFQGVQARTQLSCFALHPSPINESKLDAFSIRGLVELRRLRRDASWVISTTRFSDDKGKVQSITDREFFDQETDPSNTVGLLKEFCSQPLPRFRMTGTESGFMNLELEGTSVGSASAVTCFNGDILRAKIPRFREANDQTGKFRSKINTPCEVLILDLLLHENSYGKVVPRVNVYSDHRAEPTLPRQNCDLIPVRESVVYMGRGPEAVGSPDVPRYVEMVQWALDRVGWDGEKFDVWRCRVEYPVMPSSVVVQFDLPEKPD